MIDRPRVAGDDPDAVYQEGPDIGRARYSRENTQRIVIAGSAANRLRIRHHLP